MDKTILLGPWGGNGGNSWDDGVHTGVRDITLVYGDCIDSIRVTYDKYGRPFPAEKHGGVGGTKTAQIKLNFPEEVLISVSGHYGLVYYRGVICSLTFKSNQRTFGPFGVEEGAPFNFLTNGGHIVGFYGRSGWYIDSLGFILAPNPTLLGPWGGNGGHCWDDGVHTGVRDITLVYGNCIDSIGVTYDKYGRPFPAEKHGGTGGTKTAQIKLNFPEEVLISVSGHYDLVYYRGVIRSLTFKSNQRTFGPFGVEEGTPFNFLTNGGHIVGFYGRSGWFIDSLGFILAPKITPKISASCILM